MVVVSFHENNAFSSENTKKDGQVETELGHVREHGADAQGPARRVDRLAGGALHPQVQVAFPSFS